MKLKKRKYKYNKQYWLVRFDQFTNIYKNVPLVLELYKVKALFRIKYHPCYVFYLEYHDSSGEIICSVFSLGAQFLLIFGVIS